MNAVETSRNRISDGLAALWRGLGSGRSINRGAAWGMMIVGALVAFEIFNFSTTEFALRDVLGSLAFAGLPWATVLAVAFCTIDFAGIARIFTPQQGGDEPREVWYLFGAWLLAAAFNATLTWWGVSIAIVSRANSGSAQVLGSHTLTAAVPVFVAVLVWLIRVLIIGTLSVSGDKLFSMADSRRSRQGPAYPPAGGRQSVEPAVVRASQGLSAQSSTTFRPSAKPATVAAQDPLQPTYQNLAMESGSQAVGAGHREHRIQ
jgi:hypothetical protein